MERFVYQPYHLTFLKLGYPLMSLEDLTRVFNKKFRMFKTEQQIKSTLKNHSITCGRKTGSLLKGRFLRFSKVEAHFIRDTYKDISVSELTELFNERFENQKTLQQIRSFVHNHGINSGRTGQFNKGHKPWNAGTKGQGLTGQNSGTFKKGSVPPNRKPLGSERIDTRDGYIYIKVAETDPYTGFPTRYKLKHHHIWEKHKGPIPKGMIVSFIDGNKLNCTIENLELLTKAENAFLNKNGLRAVPDELRPTARAMAKLATKTFELKRDLREAKA